MLVVLAFDCSALEWATRLAARETPPLSGLLPQDSAERPEVTWNWQKSRGNSDPALIGAESVGEGGNPARSLTARKVDPSLSA